MMFSCTNILNIDIQNLLKPYFISYLDMLIICSHDNIDGNRMEHTEEKAPLSWC